MDVTLEHGVLFFITSPSTPRWVVEKGLKEGVEAIEPVGEIVRRFRAYTFAGG